jgi:hypothetical protein
MLYQTTMSLPETGSSIRGWADNYRDEVIGLYGSNCSKATN